MDSISINDHTIESVAADVDAAVMSGLRATISPMVALVKDANSKYRTLEHILTGLPRHLELVDKYNDVANRLSQLESNVTVRVDEIMHGISNTEPEGTPLESFLREAIKREDAEDAIRAYESVLEFLSIDVSDSSSIPELLSEAEETEEGKSHLEDEGVSLVKVGEAEEGASQAAEEAGSEDAESEDAEDAESEDAEAEDAESEDAVSEEAERATAPGDEEAERTSECCASLSCDENEEPDLPEADNDSEDVLGGLKPYDALQDEDGQAIEAFIDPDTKEIFQLTEDGDYEMIGQEIDGEFVDVEE